LLPIGDKKRREAAPPILSRKKEGKRKGRKGKGKKKRSELTFLKGRGGDS